MSRERAQTPTEYNSVRQKKRIAEKKNVYTLDEALKLYALFDMEQDIEAARAEELKSEAKRR